MTNPDLSPADIKQAPNFDKLARAYRWMELFSFGPLLSRTRTTFLERLTTGRRALVVGDGDGRFLAQLLRVNPHVVVDAIDASPAMLDSLLKRCHPHADRVTVRNIDARRWQASDDAEYDLIATHFFLDCLTQAEVEVLACKVKAAASPDARWIVSEFAIPAGPFGAFIARPLIGSLYWAFWLLTGLRVRILPDHSAALRAAGFCLEQRVPRLGQILVAEIWTLDHAAPAQPSR